MQSKEKSNSLWIGANSCRARRASFFTCFCPCWVSVAQFWVKLWSSLSLGGVFKSFFFSLNSFLLPQNTWKFRYLGDSPIELGSKRPNFETGMQTVYVSERTEWFPDISFPREAMPGKALGMQAIPKSYFEKVPSLQHLTSLISSEMRLPRNRSTYGFMFLPHIKLLCSSLFRGTPVKTGTHVN